MPKPFPHSRGTANLLPLSYRPALTLGTPMFRHYRFELLMLLLILCAIIAACFYV
ncbi:small membrane protein YdgU [Edwardsiella anguillarum]